MTALDIASHAAERVGAHMRDALDHCRKAKLFRDRAEQCRRPPDLAELVREANRSWWRAENEVEAALCYIVEVVGDDQAAHRAMGAARELLWVATEAARRAHDHFIEAEAIEKKARELEQQRAPLRVFRDARVHA